MPVSLVLNCYRLRLHNFIDVLDLGKQDAFCDWRVSCEPRLSPFRAGGRVFLSRASCAVPLISSAADDLFCRLRRDAARRRC